MAVRMATLELAHPAALWLLVLAAPIAALHLYRGRKRTVEVPCLALWERVLETQVSGSGLRRLRNLLLLALNLAALGLVVGALGEPRRPVAPVTARAWVLIVDTSLSMRARDCEGGDRWSTAVGAVRSFLAALSPTDRVLLVACGTSVRAAGPHPPGSERLATFLAGLAPGGVEAPLDRALAIARALLPEPERPEVIFFSDGAGVAGLSDFARAPGHWFVCLGQRTDHLALLNADVDRMWGSRRALVFARAHNYGAYRREAMLTVRAGDKAVNDRKLVLPPGQDVTVTLEIPSDVGDRLVVELGDPDFFADDRRAFLALQPFRRPKVLVVSPQGPDPFLVSILAALKDALDAEGSGSVTPDRFGAARKTLGPDDIVVFDGTSPPAPLPPGNYLFLGSEGPNVPVRITGRVEKPVVWRWAGDPAVFRPIALDALRVGVSRVGKPGAEDHSLIECPQGALGIFGRQESVYYAWLGFRLADSNLPLLVAYPLFVKGLFAWFAGRRDWVFDEAYALGTPIVPRVPLPDGVQSVTVSDESDASRRWQVPVLRRGFEFWGADRPGFYRISIGGAWWRTGVNLASATESDLAPRRELARFPPQPAGGATPAEEPWALYLSCAAVAVLIGEWFLYHRTQE